MKKHINVYTFCVIITLIIFAAFTARLVDWQLINSENYRGQAYADGAEEIKSEPVRGQIFDKDGTGTVFLFIDLDGKMNPSGEQLRLIQQETPNWLEAVNDDTGKNVRKNLEKTTGIKYIIGGIADAYKNDKLLTNIKFNIVKN